MHKVLLVGSGRLSQHLVYWNSLQKSSLQISNWNRKSHSIEDLKNKIQSVDLIWLAISDSALVPFFEEHLLQAKAKVVHFSGALHDARMISAHPLMSFPVELMSADVYPKIHFALTGASNLQQVLPGLTNSFSLIDEKQKAFYHSLCVVAGNFPQFLWNESLNEFRKLDIPAHAVETYIQQITQNFIQLKEKSLTGPLVRKDQVTIEKNLKALENSKLKKIYESFKGVFS
jgi:2-dehydropantoate 2-reductase